MSELEQIERDLKEYLAKEPNLKREERLRYLLNVFDKHFTFRKLEHVINHHDLFNIVARSKSAFASMVMPTYVTKKKIDSTDASAIAMIESIVSYLNQHDLIKKVPKIDYTDAGSDFESWEDL